MNQLRHLQPQFDIRIGGLSGVFAEVTEFVDTVVYEERADMIRTLTFVIDKFGDVYLERLHIGQKVTFAGGTLEKMKRIFNGTITRIRTQFPNEGDVRVSVECMATSWQALGKNLAKSNVYPDMSSVRAFAKGKATMRASDIVKGIAAENNVPFGTLADGSPALLFPENGDKEFNLLDTFQQVRTSDWALLQKLAKQTGCTVWTEFQDNDEKLFFVDRSKVRNTPTDFKVNNTPISFLYPLRGISRKETDENIIKGRGRTFIEETLQPNQFILRDVAVNEDIADANSISFAASRFNFDTGEEVSLISERITEGDKTKIIFYELDSEKVDRLEATNPERAKQLRDMGMFNIDWKTAKEFYRQIEVVDEDTAVFDQAFFGITINATVNGDVDIRSQRSYLVKGIARYSSRSREDYYWMFSLRHRWERGGDFLTDIEMKK